MTQIPPIQIYVVGTQEQAHFIQQVLASANIPVVISYGKARSAMSLARRDTRFGGSAGPVNVSFKPGFIIQVADRETLYLLGQVAQQNNKPVWISVLMNEQPNWIPLQIFLQSEDVQR
jgi:hypothetical protein